MKISKLIESLEELKSKQGDIDVPPPRQVTDLGLKKYIPCAACKQRCLIANVVLYQTHWYTPPSGCTDGDYWNEGECQFVCHHCDVANRLLFKTEWDSSRLRSVSKANDVFRWQYRDKFKQVIDTHGDDESQTRTHRWINNYWIDTLKESKCTPTT